MKNYLVLFIVSVFGISACKSQVIECRTEKMQAEIISMGKAEQELRMEVMPLVAAYQKDGTGVMKLFMKVSKMNRLDEENQARLTAYFEKCGWPDSLTEEAHNYAFLILQHSPDSMMHKYFPEVKKKVKLGLLAPDDEATMYDRLQMNAGLPQKFGTQTFGDDEDRNMVWPVQSLDSLSLYRESVGLPSMETYFKLAKDSTGVEMYWDKTLTLEEAVSIRADKK